MHIDLNTLNDPVATEALLYRLARESLPERDIERIRVAHAIAARSHERQRRNDNQPYIIHPVRVAVFLLGVIGIKDPDILAAALLHDVVEDSPTTVAEIRSALGKRVADYVEKLTRWRPKGESEDHRVRSKRESWAKVMRSEFPVRIIKAADYLDNAVSWKRIAPDHPAQGKMGRWLRELERMYIPLARVTSEEIYRLLEGERHFYRSQSVPNASVSRPR